MATSKRGAVTDRARIEAEHEAREAEAAAAATRIEKQIAKALRPLGKLSLPTKERRNTTVTSATGSSLNVVVQIERSGGYHVLPTGTFSVLVQEVRGINYRIKYRAKSFPRLGKELTAKQLDAIKACVEKHLAALDEVERERKAERTESKRAERKAEARQIRLKRIMKAHKLESGTLNNVNLDVACEGDDFRVVIHRLSEERLQALLKFWTSSAPE